MSMKKEITINADVQKGISRFYLIEKVTLILMVTSFIIGFIGILFFPVIYNFIKDTIYFKFYTKIVLISAITAIIIGIISGNRPRRCPVCKEWMVRIAPMNKKIIYRCERDNIEVNTHLPNTTS